MIKYFIVCFELGYEVEDMTELYDSLTGLFGYGGTVEREKDGKVTGFKLQTKYGILRLDYEKKVLEHIWCQHCGSKGICYIHV